MGSVGIVTVDLPGAENYSRTRTFTLQLPPQILSRSRSMLGDQCSTGYCAPVYANNSRNEVAFPKSARVYDVFKSRAKAMVSETGSMYAADTR
jgi:hypothetical protein